MYYNLITATCIAFSLNQCFAEVLMELGVSQIVMFDEGEMQVRVHNPHGAVGEISFCFEASPDTVTAKCPQGYAQLYTTLNTPQREETYWVTRDSRLSRHTIVVIEGKIKFREDGSIKVLLAEQANMMSVSLVNAKVFVPKEPKEKEKSYKTLYWVIFGLALLAILIIIAAVTLYFCCNKRPIRHQSTNNNDDQFIQPQNDRKNPSSSTASTTKTNQGEKVVLLSSKPRSATPV